jgi:hypothetical protein
MKKQIWILLISLALSSMACSVTLPFNLTSGNIGEIKTLQISETYDSSETVFFGIEMGAGELDIVGGSKNLVEGTVRYNVEEWKPEVNWDNNRLTIRQKISTLPIQPNKKIENSWNLQLGNQPMQISITAGAYNGNLDLSGVSVTNLEIQDGAGNAEVTFNTVNPVQMEEFNYQTGASDVKISGLANANVRRFSFDGGAGKAVFDFSGSLQNDMDVRINAGAGDFHIIIPEGTNCILNNNGELVDIKNNGWQQNGDQYTITGTGPTIEIEANINLGSLVLEIQ